MLHVIHRIDRELFHGNAERLASLPQTPRLDDGIDFTRIVQNADCLAIGLNLPNKRHLFLQRPAIVRTRHVSVRRRFLSHQLRIFKIGNRRAHDGNILRRIGHRLRRRCGNRGNQVVFPGNETIGNRLQIGLIALRILLIDLDLVQKAAAFQGIKKALVRFIKGRMLHDLHNPYFLFAAGRFFRVASATRKGSRQRKTCQTCRQYSLQFSGFHSTHPPGFKKFIRRYSPTILGFSVSRLRHCLVADPCRRCRIMAHCIPQWEKMQMKYDVTNRCLAFLLRRKTAGSLELGAWSDVLGFCDSSRY